MLNKKNYEPMTAAQAVKVEKLRTIIKNQMPPRRLDETLLIGTFNIREFGVKDREGYAINALAEICSCFDVLAVQEVRTNLGDLNRMLRVMGPYYKAVFNDASGEPRRPGNDERFVFIYDSRVVRFTGMAAELLISDDFLGKAGKPVTKISVPWRTPYMASFRAANFDFMLLTVHIQWNADGGIKARAKEIGMIAQWVGKRKNDAKLYDPDIFVLGDFNIPGLGSSTFKALKSHGLTVPPEIQKLKSNLKKTNHFDQIAYYKENTDCVIHSAGVLDFFSAFFTKSMSASAYGKMTRQISDHLPLWIEIDLLETALDQFIKQ